MGRYKTRQLRFRAGQIGAAGGQPIHPHSRIIKSVCSSRFACSGTTAGDVMGFEPGNWGAPCTPIYNVTFTESETAANHPSEHPEVVAGGWKESQVLSAMYRFDVAFLGDDNNAQDWVFAYKFGISFAAPLVFTAGTVTIDNWKDMRQSRGWVWKRFSGNASGGSVYPSSGRIEIKIPSLWSLYDRLLDDEIEEDGMQAAVQDAASAPTLRVCLHICVFTPSGTALAATDVSMDLDVFQDVRLTRSTQTAEMIDEADQVG